MVLAPIPGLEAIFITEYYPDWNDPDTGELGAHAKLYLNTILLAAAMIFRMSQLVRFLVTFTQFRSTR